MLYGLHTLKQIFGQFSSMLKMLKNAIFFICEIFDIKDENFIKNQLVTKPELKYLDLEHYGLRRLMARFFPILFSIF
tara:strand:- start:14577 stop:14807 length:231 start_codon:yes stop_codon:yes gene_type:complete